MNRNIGTSLHQAIELLSYRFQLAPEKFIALGSQAVMTWARRAAEKGYTLNRNEYRFLIGESHTL